MTGRLFAHIGPPKTATTALQLSFESLVDERYAYLGKLRPRDRDGDTVSRLLQTIVRDGEIDHFSQAASHIAKEIEQDKVLLFSEEMLLVHQREADIVKKLSRLAKALEGLPVTVLITLRDPSSALPSLYQEMYSRLDLLNASSFSRFCRSGYALAFDYETLEKLLLDSGFSSIRWIAFEAIGDGRLTTRDIFSEFDLWNARVLDLAPVNVGKKGGAEHKRTLPRSSLRSLARIPLVRRFLNYSGISGSRISNRLGSAVDRLSVAEAGNRDLVLPPDVYERLMTGYRERLGSLTADNSRQES